MFKQTPRAPGHITYPTVTLLLPQVFGIMVNTVPLVDCSEAVHLRDDLTEDEKEVNGQRGIMLIIYKNEAI